VTTAAAQTGPQPQFAIEGSVFVGGAVVQWLRDGLRAIDSASAVQALAQESIAYQSAALLAAMGRDAQACGGAAVTELRVDGGACVNDLLMQFQADLLGVPVVRPKVIETTARGAAFLAGLSTGVYRGLDELEALWQPERTFHPTLPPGRASELMAQWEHAVRQTVAS
jgi:glycerol kinase